MQFAKPHVGPLNLLSAILPMARGLPPLIQELLAEEKANRQDVATRVSVVALALVSHFLAPNLPRTCVAIRPITSAC